MLVSGLTWRRIIKIIGMNREWFFFHFVNLILIWFYVISKVKYAFVSRYEVKLQSFDLIENNILVINQKSTKKNVEYKGGIVKYKDEL